MAEQAIAQLIQDHYFTVLKADLSSQKFGDLKNSNDFADIESLYTEGALKDTYLILMRDAGADLNQNGRIDSESEAAQMPCLLLMQLEALWQEKQCSWYEKDPYNPLAPHCQGLKGRSLASLVFPDQMNYAFPIDRIQVCKAQK